MIEGIRRLAIVATVLLFLLLICRCQEKIPEGPERGQVVGIALRTENNRLAYPQETHYELRYHVPPAGVSMDEWQYATDYQVPFDVWIYNNFDEAFEGTKWQEVRIDLWPADPEGEWHTSVSFSDTLQQGRFTLPPGDSTHIVSAGQLRWYQRDDADSIVHPTQQYIPMQVDAFIGRKRFPGGNMPWTFCDTTYLAPIDTVLFFEEPVWVKAQATVKFLKEYPSYTSNILDFVIEYLPPPRRKLTCREGPPDNSSGH